MEAMNLAQIEAVIGGELNAVGWGCNAGTIMSGAIWSYILGLACASAGAVVCVAWSILSAWACDYANDLASQHE